MEWDGKVRGGAGVEHPGRMEPEEARLFALGMQDTFEGREIPWREDYDALMGEDDWGWFDGPEWNRWRIAAYIAWASCPADRRSPATIEEFARLVGWSPRSLRKYRSRHPEIEQMVRENILQPLFQRRATVLQTLVQQAELPDYKSFKDRELFLKLVGLYQPSQDVNLTARQVTADDMAAAQQQAEEELAEYELAERIDGD